MDSIAAGECQGWEVRVAAHRTDQRSVWVRTAVLILLLATPGTTVEEYAGLKDNEAETSSPVDEGVRPAVSYDTIMADFWQWRLEQSPELATSLGVTDHNHRLESYTLQAMDHRQERALLFLRDIARVEGVEELSGDEVHNLALLTEDLTAFVAGYKWRLYGGLNPLSRLEGVHRDFTYWLDATLFTDADSFETYITRLTALASQVHEQIALMREAVRLGVTNHQDSMSGVLEQIRVLQHTSAISTPFYGPFNDSLEFASVSINMADKLRAKGAAVIQDHVLPAYTKLSTFLSQEYLPSSREKLGVGDFPLGHDYYRACLQWYLSSDISPVVIHGLGKRTIADLLSSIEEVKVHTGYVGQVADFLKYAEGASKFFYRTKKELLNAYKTIVQRKIPSRLSSVFKQTKVAPVIVEEMKFDGPEAVLMPGSEGGDMPAIFFVNLQHPLKRQKWKLMTTALHEYIPGRHFQNCYERNQSLPHFRKWREYRKLHAIPFHFPIHSAYTEGWALYAESLGHDMKIYKRPYDRLGQYYSELWRTVEMVVDTGIHRHGWTRKIAEEYFLQTTACSRTDAAKAVTQILTFPAQAVAPSFGHMKIRQLRRKAEFLLGPDFDLAEFHEEILRQGPVSLQTLHHTINSWINERARTSSAHRAHSHVTSVALALFVIITALTGHT